MLLCIELFSLLVRCTKLHVIQRKYCFFSLNTIFGSLLITEDGLILVWRIRSCIAPTTAPAAVSPRSFQLSCRFSYIVTLLESTGCRLRWHLLVVWNVSGLSCEWSLSLETVQNVWNIGMRWNGTWHFNWLTQAVFPKWACAFTAVMWLRATVMSTEVEALCLCVCVYVCQVLMQATETD